MDSSTIIKALQTALEHARRHDNKSSTLLNVETFNLGSIFVRVLMRIYACRRAQYTACQPITFMLTYLYVSVVCRMHTDRMKHLLIKMMRILRNALNFRFDAAIGMLVEEVDSLNTTVNISFAFAIFTNSAPITGNCHHPSKYLVWSEIFLTPCILTPDEASTHR
jgi:hypothetical protein